MNELATDLERRFDVYQPNIDSLLPPELSRSLYRKAGWEFGPHRFYGALSLLPEFKAEFCWWSSRLAGSQLSLADVATLVRSDVSGRLEQSVLGDDARLVLNHRDALNLMVFSRHPRIATPGIIARVNQLLVHGRVEQESQKICARLETKLHKLARQVNGIENPVEASFFLWIRLATLGAFNEGNQRTARVLCNLPLLTGHCAPISFANVNAHDLAYALSAAEDHDDLTPSIQVFEQALRRSMGKFLWVLCEAARRRVPSQSHDD